jgi:hypothetical protein
MASEVLNISVTKDARDLFVEHDIATIKKIRSTALDEIDRKKTVLRDFIGANYRPLLNTPTVLEQIKSIVQQAQGVTGQLESFTRDFTASSGRQKPGAIHPFSAASQLYLRSLKRFDDREFKLAVDLALEAAEALARCDRSILADTLRTTVGSLPARIFRGIEAFVGDPSAPLTAESLSDCFAAASLMFDRFPTFSTGDRPAPSSFIQSRIIARVAAMVGCGTQIDEICLLFLNLIEAIVSFLASNQAAALNRLLNEVILMFGRSFNSAFEKFADSELRDILRIAKSVADTLRNRSPRFVAALRDLDLTLNFWNDAFLDVFSGLAAQSIETSIARLDLAGRVSEILGDPNLSKFNAVMFALGDSSDLKTRSLGVSPLITEFQRYVDSRLLLLSSQIQSQAIQIASTEMLRRPLIDSIGRTSKTLSDSIQSSPLSVCLLTGSLSSPSISALLTDALAKQLADVQQAAALEWAKRTASD